MQILTKQEYFKIESTQSEDSIPPKEHIKKCVYDPYGELEQSESGEDDEHPISLEELEQEEKKTKRPNHQRPVTKLFIIGLGLIPAFAFIYLFMGGTKKPAQIARAIQQAEPQVDQELISQNQQLQKQIDQMELELAKLKQQQNSPPSPAPKPEVKKVETPPPPPKQPPVKTTPKPVAQKPGKRPKPVQKKPAPTRPTPEQLMRRRQLLAQSVVFGGTILNNQQSVLTVAQSEYEPEITSSPNPVLVSSRNQPNQALLMANVDNSPAVQEPIDFSIGSPQSNSRQSPSIQKQLTKQFTPGTSMNLSH